jgi:hypothetical protein
MEEHLDRLTNNHDAAALCGGLLEGVFDRKGDHVLVLELQRRQNAIQRANTVEDVPLVIDSAKSCRRYGPASRRRVCGDGVVYVALGVSPRRQFTYGCASDCLGNVSIHRTPIFDVVADCELREFDLKHEPCILAALEEGVKFTTREEGELHPRHTRVEHFGDFVHLKTTISNQSMRTIQRQVKRTCNGNNNTVRVTVSFSSSSSGDSWRTVPREDFLDLGAFPFLLAFFRLPELGKPSGSVSRLFIRAMLA